MRRQRRDAAATLRYSHLRETALAALAALRTTVVADVLAELFHAGRTADDVVEGFLLPNGVVIRVQSRDGSATFVSGSASIRGLQVSQFSIHNSL